MSISPFPIVVVKRSRLKGSCRFLGGILNPAKKYYIYRTQGNRNPMPILEKQHAAIVREAQRIAQVNGGQNQHLALLGEAGHV